MNDQMIIFILILISTIGTILLYLQKSKKQYQYLNDERWQLVQIKANNIANLVNWILILILALASSITVFTDQVMSFSFNRVIIFGLLFIGFRNLLELFAVLYYDRNL